MTITVERDSARTELDMTRAEVVFPTVIGEVVDGHIGWLGAPASARTAAPISRPISPRSDEQADRWVVDLRGNPGGEATSVVEAVGHVLGNRTVAYLVDREGA
ncbi:MAG: S41 family peptidase [Intestinimonas sp.]